MQEVSYREFKQHGQVHTATLPEFRATLCSAIPQISVLMVGPYVVLVQRKENMQGAWGRGSNL